MPGIPDGVRDVAERFDVSAVLDILLITVAIYWLLLLLRGTTAMTVLRGVSVLLFSALLLARIFDLSVVNWILERMIPGLVIGVIVVFQPEIRRALERLGRTGWRPSLVRAEQERSIEHLVRAASRLARQRHGALVVIERETGLQEVIDTGVPLGSELTPEILGSIFAPGTPLHDGAVIVRSNTIIAAGCTLPLSEAQLPVDLGMRHRAALGITELSDAVVVTVSEESGSISLASHGRIRTNVSEEQLRPQLRELFGLAAEELSMELALQDEGAPRREAS